MQHEENAVIKYILSTVGKFQLPTFLKFRDRLQSGHCVIFAAGTENLGSEFVLGFSLFKVL